MLKRFAILLLAVLVFACGKTEKKEAKAAEMKAEVVEIQLDSLFAHMEDMVGKTVKIEGTIVHTCQHGGKRAHVVGTNPDRKLRLETTDNVEKFNKEMEGSEVVAEGVVIEQIIDEAYLAKWESDMKEAGESKQELHEGHKKEHEGMTEQEENMAKIEAYRKILKEKGVEKLEYHWVDCTKYTLKEK